MKTIFLIGSKCDDPRVIILPRCFTSQLKLTRYSSDNRYEIGEARRLATIYIPMRNTFDLNWILIRCGSGVAVVRKGEKERKKKRDDGTVMVLTIFKPTYITCATGILPSVIYIARGSRNAELMARYSFN